MEKKYGYAHTMGKSVIMRFPKFL